MRLCKSGTICLSCQHTILSLYLRTTNLLQISRAKPEYPTVVKKLSEYNTGRKDVNDQIRRGWNNSKYNTK